MLRCLYCTDNWHTAVQRIVKDVMVPIELFGEPWVLFRDEHGAAACVRDECAHRACPLSLGSVIDGRVQVSCSGPALPSAASLLVLPAAAVWLT